MTPRSPNPDARLLRRVAVAACALMSFAGSASSAETWRSAMVGVDTAGRLAYPTDAEGNRIVDFSHAGYRGGGIPIPDVPAVKTVAPVEGDNTAHLQAALDQVGAMPLRIDGFRGALLLTPGIYEVRGTLHLRHSGVVLRGAGAGEDPAHHTILRRTGTSTATVILAGGGRGEKFRAEVPGTRTGIRGERVPLGARTIEVGDARAFRVGDAVVIEQRSTAAWLASIRGGDTGDDAPWKPGEIDIRYARHVVAVAGNSLTLDAPVYSHLECGLARCTVFRHDRSGYVSGIGVENLAVDIVTAGEESEDHAEICVQFARAEDCWARGVHARHFVHAGVQFGPSCLRGTAVDCRATDPHSIVTGGRRYNFATEEAQLILFERCFASKARHAFICNGAALDSGVVVLDCVSEGQLATTEGHRRWSQAILFDGLRTVRPATKYVLGLYNRGDMGTGHGWAVVHSVAWRCEAGGRTIVVQKPPSGQNYAIGCSGGTVGGTGPFRHTDGYIEGTGRGATLEPQSLYRAQVAERLGAGR